MRHEGPHGGHRHERLEQVLLEELRGVLRDEVADPALGAVVLTALSLSVDYRHARVHFALRGVAEADEARARAAAERGLARATPFLRAQLADAIDLKRVPDLRFVFDAAAVLGDDERGAGA